jgi:hypothetical protein
MLIFIEAGFAKTVVKCALYIPNWGDGTKHETHWNS